MVIKSRTSSIITFVPCKIIVGQIKAVRQMTQKLGIPIQCLKV